jgi:hypothetical protein
MDATTAFEKFEKRGAGIWPVIALSLLALAATVLAVHLAKQLKGIENSAIKFINIGYTAAKALGFDKKLGPLNEQSVELYRAAIDAQRTEFDKALPKELIYCGLYQSSGLDELWHQTWLEAEGKFQIEVLPLQRSSNGTYYPVLISSQTEDNVWLVTSNEAQYLPAPPWQELNVFDPSSDLLDVWLPKMLAQHRLFIDQRKLTPLARDNYVSTNDGRKRREMLWLIEQAPLPVDTFEKLLRAKLPEVRPEEMAQVLIGFCAGLCKSYDTAAVVSFRDQLTDNTSQAEDESELVVLHGMTNQLYITLRLLGPLADFSELNLKWTQELLRDGKTTPQAVEAHLKKLTQRAPLIEIGEIQQPFPAKIFRIPAAALATRVGKSNSDKEIK